MTETVRFGLVGKQDLKIGTGTFEVRLGDGRVVTLDEIQLEDFVSSLTVGSVLFVKATGIVGEDNSNLFWDDTNNRLGIGNAAPTVPLDVTGAARVGTDLTVVDQLIPGRINSPDTTALLFYNNANTTERMRLTDAGILLLGTTVTTGASAGDIVLPIQNSLRGVNAASNAALEMVSIRSSPANELLIGNSTSPNIEMRVATSGGLLLTAMFQQFQEVTAPSAGAANSVRLYADDNGLGKTRLVAVFATGAAQTIVTEP